MMSWDPMIMRKRQTYRSIVRVLDSSPEESQIVANRNGRHGGGIDVVGLL